MGCPQNSTNIKANKLKSMVKKDATKRLKSVFISGAKKAGFDEQRVMGALYMLFIDYDAPKQIGKEMLELLDQSVKRYDALVDIILGRVNTEK